jgi:hypothetical protein
MKNRLRQAMLKNSFKSSIELKKKILVCMIQHVLQKQFGLPSRIAAKKPLLTQAMVKKSLKICHIYKYKAERD